MAKPSRRNHVDMTVRHPSGKAHAKRLTLLGKRFLNLLGVQGTELSLALVGDEEIQVLNKSWRKKNKATDVLSFPAGPMPEGVPGPMPLGDVIISMDTAILQSKEAGRTLKTELNRYLAHGILHLLGHDHHKPAETARMAAAEAALLGEPGMVPSKRTRGAITEPARGPFRKRG